MNVLSPASAGWDIWDIPSSSKHAFLSWMELLPQLQPPTAIRTPILTPAPLLCQWWVAEASLALAQGPARVQGVVLGGRGE